MDGKEEKQKERAQRDFADFQFLEFVSNFGFRDADFRTGDEEGEGEYCVNPVVS
jgi:hypothetical protein